MQRDGVYLLDILEAAKLAISYIEGRDRDAFLKDIQCQDSVIRRLEIIGEAARRISEETRNVYSGLPWGDMIGMRNVMIHEYDDIDLTMVWKTVKDDLPKLVEDVEKMLKQGKHF